MLRMSVTYVGSGPYCYANSLAMILGGEAPPPAVIEVLTGSPYGMQLIGGRLPLFDPFGWDPEIGLDAAIGLLGWECERADGGTAEEALDRLRRACQDGPVLVGPLELGLLTYQPGSGQAVGADHYVVVLEAGDDTVLVHDPQGHPYATLPAGDFAQAWRGELIPYLRRPFRMRHRFTRSARVSQEEALRRSLPAGVAWLAGRADVEVPPGTLGQAEAAERTAALVEEGLDPDVRALWQAFAVRVGARRLNDLAACLSSLGLDAGASVAAEQARVVGGLQGPLVSGDDPALAAGLRRLAPTYERLRDVLASRVGTS
ncbi:hypothetical protein SAMN05660976_01018 [Nonomuraea pusilla]|uniref:Butirosin biosynthesis protein H, N-terminal n=2 Tax=Nonomuraea pusilla TaxID=46177 RepID=A0A1H7J8U5_9ACTN|nr:hypothetical protein SAMN05660976_01018 [Nonomuraea pusilla]